MPYKKGNSRDEVRVRNSRMQIIINKLTQRALFNKRSTNLSSISFLPVVIINPNISIALLKFQSINQSISSTV